jgi:GntR family transcriptional regulator
MADIPTLESDPFVPAGQVYTALADAGDELSWTEYVTARNPNPDDAATLNVPEGTPILSTRRITYDANGQPLAMEEAHRSAEDAKLAYDVVPGHM